MSIVLDGKLGLKSKEQSNSNDNDDNLDWTGIWQFAKDKTSNLAFNYKVQFTYSYFICIYLN